ncbi:MAG TPA: enoyl-CoA hydratase/isomerase family protein [Candidatus Thermoplasmatota archaeon]|nr:enoyl-CoA hydratase/isomerase family protein [Candidatus Thermoplasmatota archaeon]
MSGLRVSTQDGVRVLVIDRPARRNAFDRATIRALGESLEAFASGRDDAPALVLTGAGEAFCGGGDVKEMAEAADLRAHFLALTADHHAAVLAMRRAPKPVVTAAPGVVAGGGLGLALAGDLRLAAPEARWVAAYGALGVAPDGGSTWLLPRLAGGAVAERLLLHGETLDAEKALAAGLAHRIVPRAALLAEAIGEAKRLASAPGGGFAASKRLLGDVDALAAHLDRERAENAATGASEATRAAVAKLKR